MSKIRHLHEAVTTGRTTFPGEEIGFTARVIPGIDADSLLRQRVEMLLTPHDPPEFATVLGKTFELGPYGYISNRVNSPSHGQRVSPTLES